MKTITKNFHKILVVLDEVFDFGIPQITDPKAIADIIVPQLDADKSRFIEIPDNAFGKTSWRAHDVQHKTNDIFLDVIETIDLQKNGEVKVSGIIRGKSYLSGHPELRLGLNQILNGECNLKNFHFHQCVQMDKLGTGESDLVFVPPDGEFILFTYQSTLTEAPFEVIVEQKKASKTAIEYTVSVRSLFKKDLGATDVIVHIPVPSDVDSVKFKVFYGHYFISIIEETWFSQVCSCDSVD